MEHTFLELKYNTIFHNFALPECVLLNAKKNESIEIYSSKKMFSMTILKLLINI